MKKEEIGPMEQAKLERRSLVWQAVIQGIKDGQKLYNESRHTGYGFGDKGR